MATHNLQINSIAFADTTVSNNPMIRNWDLGWKLLGQSVTNPRSENFSIAPGASQTVFNGTRTTLIDGTTAFTVTQPYPTEPGIYRFAYASGTNPVFRTDRLLGADTTTQIAITVNGPIVTFTSIPGDYASFTGLVAGMISNVTVTANSTGSAGNSIVLNGDGVSTVAALIAAWNIANPSNQVTLTSGIGTQIPDTGIYAFYSGTPVGTGSTIVITANNIGGIGNVVQLVGDGISTVAGLISAWNTANPSNQITLSSGLGSGVPQGGTEAYYFATPPSFSTAVRITSNVPSAIGNSVCLVGDGISNLNTLIANWNILNPTNTIVLTSGNGLQVLGSGIDIHLSSGVNPTYIQLGEGITDAIQLSGGSTNTMINMTNVQVGDILNVGPGSGVSFPNQGEFTVIAKTSTSLVVQNLNAVAETDTVLDPTQFIAYSNGGGVSNQVQIGDKVIISAGFSIATQGTYTVVDVTPLYFEIELAMPNGIPLESGIVPGVTGLVFYSTAKQFVLVAAQQQCSVQVNADVSDNNIVNPVEANNPERPAIYLKQGTVYSLTIHNLSLETLSVIVATAE